MSSDACTVSSTFAVKPDVTIPEILEALQPFLDAHDIDLTEYANAATNADESNRVELENGQMHLCLQCWCAGQDFEPEGTDELVEGLGTLALTHGALEIFNQDTPADAESTVMTRFFGQNENECAIAHVTYGFEKIRLFIEPVLGADVFTEITSLALARLSAAQAQKQMQPR